MLNVCCEKDVWIYNNATAQSETLAMLFQVFLMSVDFNEVSRQGWDTIWQASFGL